MAAATADVTPALPALPALLSQKRKRRAAATVAAVVEKELWTHVVGKEKKTWGDVAGGIVRGDVGVAKAMEGAKGVAGLMRR